MARLAGVLIGPASVLDLALTLGMLLNPALRRMDAAETMTSP
jgi:hypothetical protein